MKDSGSPHRTLRSIGAVVAGALVGIILSIGTDFVLHLVGVFPPLGQPADDGPLMLATAYRTIYGIAGAYVTARLAPARPMLHAMVLGTLGLIASAAGAAATWNKSAAYGPHWYPVALVVLAIPSAWVGARLFMSRSRVQIGI